MAEVIFINLAKKNKRSDIIVKSAGTWAQVGADMTELSRQALIECGEELPASRHFATQLTMEMQKEFDYVLDLRNFPDPWYEPLEAYIEVCKYLQIYCAKLYDRICKT